MPNVIDEIAAERRRQTDVEGWTAEHDDAHTDGSMATVAACYATIPDNLTLVLHRVHVDVSGGRGDCPVWGLKDYWLPNGWPESWGFWWWKPKDRRRDLIRSAALIVAEIERLDRAAHLDEKEG